MNDMSKIYVTYDKLVKSEAFKEGVEWFKNAFGEKKQVDINKLIAAHKALHGAGANEIRPKGFKGFHRALWKWLEDNRVEFKEFEIPDFEKGDCFQSTSGFKYMIIYVAPYEEEDYYTTLNPKGCVAKASRGGFKWDSIERLLRHMEFEKQISKEEFIKDV